MGILHKPYPPHFYESFSFPISLFIPDLLLAIMQYDTDLARRTVALLYNRLNVMMTERFLDGFQYHKVLYVVLTCWIEQNHLIWDIVSLSIVLRIILVSCDGGLVWPQLHLHTNNFNPIYPAWYLDWTGQTTYVQNEPVKIDEQFGEGGWKPLWGSESTWSWVKRWRTRHILRIQCQWVNPESSYCSLI